MGPGGQVGVSSKAVGSEEVRWLSLPAPIPEFRALALSESPLSGSPALDATQSQQLVRPSAGLPSPALRQGKTQGTPGPSGCSVPSVFVTRILPSMGATVSRVPKGCLMSDLSFLPQTFHEHLACTKPSVDCFIVTVQLGLSSKPIAAAQLCDLRQVPSLL